MSKVELDYAQMLEYRLKAGQIAEWFHEQVTLKLADDTRYTPNFMVILPDGTVELHEAKRWVRDDTRIMRVRIAAQMFPFPIRMAVQTDHGWQIDEVRAA